MLTALAVYFSGMTLLTLALAYRRRHLTERRRQGVGTGSGVQ